VPAQVTETTFLQVFVTTHLLAAALQVAVTVPS
jgi:hypothetical protein